MRKCRFTEILSGGDRRSLGRAGEVIAEVERRPELFEALFDRIEDGDPLVRMRAADAAEKLSARHPEWLQPFRFRILKLARVIVQQEVRWHMALMIGRLNLDSRHKRTAVEILLRFLDDKSSIVRTLAMQGLADLSAGDPRLRKQILPVLQELTLTGTPAMRARGRHLLHAMTGVDTTNASSRKFLTH